MIKNTAGQSVGAQMIDASTGAAFTGAVTVHITIDAGSQALGSVGSGLCTHEGNGFHSYGPSQAETNGDLVACTFTGSGAIPATVQYPTISLAQQAALAQVATAAPNIYVADVCTAALQRLGVLAAGETASSEDLQLALNRLNALIGSWRRSRLFTYALVRTTFTITANDGVYTIGSGGDINIQRPSQPPRIRLINTIPTPTQEMVIRVLTDAEYAAWPQKGMTSTWPTAVYYNGTSPLGTLTFLPTPTAATLQGVVYTPNASAHLALTDILDVPEGYQLFYQENLAVHMAPDFSRQPSPILVESAREARADLKRGNQRLTDLIVCSPFTNGWYDINSNQVW